MKRALPIFSIFILLFSCLVSIISITSFTVFSQSPGPGFGELEEKLKDAAGEEKLRLLLDFKFNYESDPGGKKLSLTREMLRLAQEIGSPADRCLAFKKMGVYYYNRQNYREAVSYYLEGLKLEPEIDDKSMIADVLVNIGLVYWKLNEHETSEKYYLQALEARKKAGDQSVKLAHTLNNLGLSAWGQKKGDKALTYHRKALALYKKLGHKRGMAAALSNIAGVNQYQFKDYPTALEYYRQAIPIYRQMGTIWGVANTYQNIGKVYIRMRRFEDARESLETALKLAKEINAKGVIYSIYGGFTTLYGETGDFKQALKYNKLFSQLMDSIFDKDTAKQIARLQAQYEAGKREHEINVLRKKNKAEQHLKLFLIIIILLFLCLGTVLYGRFRANKKNNRMLAASEAKYRALFSRAGDAIFLMDRGAFIDCNEKTLEIFGVTREQIIGQTFADFSPKIQPNNRNSLESGMEWVRKALNSGPQQFYWQHSKKDGTPFDTMVSLSIITVEGRKLLQAIIQDISHTKRLEEERVKSAQLETVNLLADGITHDFNNIFMVISGNIELAQMEAGEETELYRLLTELGETANSASALSKQFLAIAEREVYSMENILLCDIIQEAVEDGAAGISPGSGKTVNLIKNPDGLWPVNGDSDKIKRVVKTLVQNAVEATVDNGYIEICCANITLAPGEVLLLPEGRYVKIIVKDDGEGIPPEHLPKVFEPYFTTHREPGRRGAGMGLAVARAITNAHKGTITVSSVMGKETVFNVYLPAVEKE